MCMKLEKIIVVLGPPGSGKGTQSELLGKALSFAYFSTGAMFREISKQNTEYARVIKDKIDNGIIVSDDEVRPLFLDKIKDLSDYPGIILDGYPRSLGQVKILEEVIQQFGIGDLKVFFLDVDKEKLVARITKRKTCPNCQAIYLPGMPEYETEICSNCGHNISVRPDDDPKVVETRFEQYLTKTADVRKYYEDKGLLIHINGDQPIEKVHQEIMEKLKIK